MIQPQSSLLLSFFTLITSTARVEHVACQTTLLVSVFIVTSPRVDVVTVSSLVAVFAQFEGQSLCFTCRTALGAEVVTVAVAHEHAT